jgi:hypothetical protein
LCEDRLGQLAKNAFHSRKLFAGSIGGIGGAGRSED